MQKVNLRKAIPSFFLVFAAMLHLPFSFAKSSVWEIPALSNEHLAISEELKTLNASTALYQNLGLAQMGLSENAYQYAMAGFEKLKNAGKLSNDHIISIVDFTKSSAQKRLFVIDMEKAEVLFNTYVAHGQNSGDAFAKYFSNKPESFQSSLGFYLTSGTYSGKNGYSMQLIGLERGINDKADKRAIVMHGAPYVNEQMARTQGHIGRSWGCPAVPEKLTRPIIDKIKDGSCLFIYANNKNYLKRSVIINS